MQCEEVREQFADYVIHRLPESKRAQIVEHLGSCEACRAELTELQSLWTRLDDIPPAEPGRNQRDRFDLMLESYKQPQRPHVSRTWRMPALQFGLAAALLVLGIGIGYRMHPSSPPSPELAELRSELSDTRQMVALSLMQQQSATDRLKGVNWSYRLQEPSADVMHALLDTLMHDPNVNVRLATVDALRQFGNQPVVRRGLIEAMTRQESPMVQIALIDLAVDLHDKESVGTLRDLTQDQNLDPAVRDRAQKGLTELE
jgi:putative zinc finger protein